MRKVLRYENGQPVWSENTPTEEVGTGRLIGELVKGSAGSVESSRAARRAYRQRERQQQ